MATLKSNRLPPRPLPPHSPDFSRPSQSPNGQRLPFHKKNTLSFEEEGVQLDASSHKRATSDCTSGKPPTVGEEGRLRRGAGSVFRLASAFTPNGDCSLTTESSQVSVEVIVSELENPSEPGEDMSETEKTIRSIIKQREAKPTKPLDLQDCISTIMTQRQAALKKQEDERWRLKQHLLSTLAQPPSLGISFDVEGSDDPVPEFNEVIRPVKVAPYQRSTEKKALKENSFREKSPSREETKDIRKCTRVQNRKTIKTALGICCGGDMYRKGREEALEAIEGKPLQGAFIIAMRGKQEYAALYQLDLHKSTLEKIAGLSQLPSQLTSAQIAACYRYDSSVRAFKSVSLRLLFSGADAVLLKPSV